MSTVDSIQVVCDRLATVEGVGPHVYNMLRNSVTDVDFTSLFVDTVTDPSNPIVRAWRVTRTAVNGKDSPFMNAEADTHNIEISGFMAYKDGSSEPEFQQVIDNIRLAFNPLGPNGSALRRFVDAEHPNGRFDWSGPLQIMGPRLGTLGNVLVHAVLMNYPIQEFPL